MDTKNQNQKKKNEQKIRDALFTLKKNNNELDKLILANILRAFDHNFEMNGKAHCESIAPATAIDLSKETFFFLALQFLK